MLSFGSHASQPVFEREAIFGVSDYDLTVSGLDVDG